MSLCRSPLSKLQAQLQQKMQLHQAALQTPALQKASLKWKPVQRILQLQNWAAQAAKAQRSVRNHPFHQSKTQGSCQALTHTIVLNTLMLRVSI